MIGTLMRAAEGTGDPRAAAGFLVFALAMGIAMVAASIPVTWVIVGGRMERRVRCHGCEEAAATELGMCGPCAARGKRAESAVVDHPCGQTRVAAARRGRERWAFNANGEQY